MISTSGSVDPVLTLFDPAGQAIATDDNSGGGTTALLRDIRLPVDGDYIIQALGGEHRWLSPQLASPSAAALAGAADRIDADGDAAAGHVNAGRRRSPTACLPITSRRLA